LFELVDIIMTICCISAALTLLDKPSTGKQKDIVTAWLDPCGHRIYLVLSSERLQDDVF